jgi:hypothetical protein
MLGKIDYGVMSVTPSLGGSTLQLSSASPKPPATSTACHNDFTRFLPWSMALNVNAFPAGLGLWQSAPKAPSMDESLHVSYVAWRGCRQRAHPCMGESQERTSATHWTNTIRRTLDAPAAAVATQRRRSMLCCFTHLRGREP